MAGFIAELSFRFESESVETAGAELRRLSDAAQGVGFDVVRGKVTPAPLMRIKTEAARRITFRS
jgi:hypothetical protein